MVYTVGDPDLSAYAVDFRRVLSLYDDIYTVGFLDAVYQGVKADATDVNYTFCGAFSSSPKKMLSVSSGVANLTEVSATRIY